MSVEKVCAYCDDTFEVVKRPGQPRKFCSETCRSEAGKERTRLRREIARLEKLELEQVRRFVLPSQVAAPKLAAARRRLRDLGESGG